MNGHDMAMRSVWGVVIGLGVITAVYLVRRELPGLRRYLRISRM